MDGKGPSTASQTAWPPLAEQLRSSALLGPLDALNSKSPAPAFPLVMMKVPLTIELAFQNPADPNTRLD